MPLVALQPVACTKCPAFNRTKLQDQRGTITSSGWILQTKKISPAPGTVKFVLDIRFHRTGLQDRHRLCQAH